MESRIVQHCAAQSLGMNDAITRLKKLSCCGAALSLSKNASHIVRQKKTGRGSSESRGCISHAVDTHIFTSVMLRVGGHVVRFDDLLSLNGRQNTETQADYRFLLRKEKSVIRVEEDTLSLHGSCETSLIMISADPFPSPIRKSSVNFKKRMEKCLRRWASSCSLWLV